MLAAVVAASIVHIVTTLSVPMAAGAGAYNRLAAVLEPNRMVVLPKAGPATQALPFLAPDARFAICRFDIGDGPVAFAVTLPERGWMLTLHTDIGDIFYVAPGQDVRSIDVKFRLVPQTERLFGILPGGRSMDGDGTSVASPSRRGLAVLRAPYVGEAFNERIEAILSRASCTLEKT